MCSPVDSINHFLHGTSDFPGSSLVDPIFYEIQRGSIISSWLGQHYLSGLHERGPFYLPVLGLQPVSLSFVPPYPEGKPALYYPVS